MGLFAFTGYNTYALLALLLAADRALLQLLFQKETEAVCTYAGLR